MLEARREIVPTNLASYHIEGRNINENGTEGSALMNRTHSYYCMLDGWFVARSAQKQYRP